MILSEKTKKAILELQKLYPERRSALIPALHLAQEEAGCLSIEVQEVVATLFGISVNEVHAVVTFYDLFHEEPKGKCILHVCKNVSCMLRGSDEVLKHLCHKLQVGPGGTTADGKFSVIPSECLAACDIAPMMIVGEKVVGPVKIEDNEQILTGEGYA